VLEAAGFAWDRMLCFSFLTMYSEVPRLVFETVVLGKRALYGKIKSHHLRKTECHKKRTQLQSNDS